MITIKSLDTKLWKIFSEYIRLRDSKDGLCKCITCDTIHHWKEMDAGHFITRGKKSTKFDEKNVHAQCRKCNRFMSGFQYKYSIAIDEKYGEGTAKSLYIKSEMLCKRTVSDYEYLIKEYKEKLEVLRANT